MKSKSNIFILTMLLLFGAMAFIISVDTFFRNQSATKDLLRIKETQHLLTSVQTALNVGDPDLIYESAYSLKSMAELPLKGDVVESWALLNNSIKSLEILNTNHQERVANFEKIVFSKNKITQLINEKQKGTLSSSQVEDLNYLEILLDSYYKSLLFIYRPDETVSLSEEAVYISSHQKEAKEFIQKIVPDGMTEFDGLEKMVDTFLASEIDFQANLKKASQKINGLEVQVNELLQNKIEAIEDLNKFAIMGLILSLAMTSFGLFLLLKKLENATDN